MAEAAETPDAAAEPETCLYCGTELGETPSPAKGLCVPCTASVLPSSSAKRESGLRAAASTPLVPPAKPLEPRRASKAPNWNRALCEVRNEPYLQTRRMVDELVVADKRVIGFMALIPFVGPWLVHRSDAYGAREKRTLIWMSVLVTAAILVALIYMLPTEDQMRTNLQNRMQDQMRALASFAEQYRSQHDTYPGLPTWRHYIERADPRFYDPWGRPYLYEATDAGVTLRSLGRDGALGGYDEDADVSATFPAAPVK